MKDLLQQVDRIPVTLLVAIAYVTLFALTNMQASGDDYGEVLAGYGILCPLWVADGEPWRMLTAAFLHLNLLHIGFNLFALVAIGPSLEMSLGSLRFAVVYVVAALGGHIAVCLVYEPQDVVLGGSGALFGMMGGVLALNMRAGRHVFSFLEFEGPRRLIGLIVVNLVLGFVIPMVSNTAHVGGLFAGFLVTFLWLVPGRTRSATLGRWRAALTALFATLLFWCLEPATRWDHLWYASLEATGERAAALRRAAGMAALATPVSEAQAVLYFEEAAATFRKR